ncbi:MAG: group 1 truncated hemoglobin [Planctomycetota bacterium]
MSSLYERLGGDAAIRAAVPAFYDKVMADERVVDFFDDIDMEVQMEKQRSFLTFVTGGPEEYTGEDMRTGHRRLVAMGLADVHVDVILEHLGQTLRELGAGSEEIGEVAALAESVRDDVLDR